ncbi:MAG: PfkB family carbohydrate kinase [Bacteroidota bacterium]
MLDFSGLRILVVGDLMIDRYLHGRVDRISPEAPVPVVRLQDEENRLGGAANVALNIKALGAEAILAGVVGHDQNGKVCYDLIHEAGLDASCVIADSDRPTTVKTRLVSGGQQLMRVDREETHLLSKPDADRLLKAVDTAIAKGVDIILFQDYNKGVLGPVVIAKIQQAAHRANCPWQTVVDPKVDNFFDYKNCGVFKPNLKEIRQQLPFAIDPTLPDLDKAAGFVFEQLDCKAVMITLSDLGIYVNDRTSSKIYPTHARKVADVSGAGDTVIAVLACGLAAGMELGEIAQLANLAGGQVIAKPGVVPVELEQLQRVWELQLRAP